MTGEIHEILWQRQVLKTWHSHPHLLIMCFRSGLLRERDRGRQQVSWLQSRDPRTHIHKIPMKASSCGAHMIIHTIMCLSRAMEDTTAHLIMERNLATTPQPPRSVFISKFQFLLAHRSIITNQKIANIWIFTSSPTAARPLSV
jgi:hypothetical protein